MFGSLMEESRSYHSTKGRKTKNKKVCKIVRLEEFGVRRGGETMCIREGMLTLCVWEKSMSGVLSLNREKELIGHPDPRKL
jgi:hypothetical protein